MANKKIVQFTPFYLNLMMSTSDLDSGQILSPYGEKRKNYLQRYWKGKFKANKKMIFLN